jgi:hypothetical protein
MHRKIRPLARFEQHSVALFAALVMGSTGVAAQSVQQAATLRQGTSSSTSSAHTVHMSDRPPARPGNSVDTAFTRADADGDDRLSRDEAQRFPAVTERFDEIDADHDRFLSRAEFRRGVSN